MNEQQLEEGEIDVEQYEEIKSKKTTNSNHKAQKKQNKQQSKITKQKVTFEQTLQRDVFDNLQILAPNICMICKEKVFKYKCPGCMRKTCSIQCCTKHKIVYKCSGSRDPTKLVRMSQYSSKEALGDFNFLKQIILDTEVVQKKLVGTSALPDALRYKLLKQQAKRLLNADIHLAPKIMERHRLNISFYCVKDKQIYWCTEFKVYLGQQNYHTHLTDPVCMTLSISDILKTNDIFSTDILTKYDLNLSEEHLKKKQNDIKIFYSFKKVVAFLEQEEYLFKAQKKRKQRKWKTQIPNQETNVQDIEQNAPILQEVTLDSYLKDIIQDSTIYEYPTILIVHKKFLKQFYEFNNYEIEN